MPDATGLSPEEKKVEWCFMPTFIIINLHKYFYHKVGGGQIQSRILLMVILSRRPASVVEKFLFIFNFF